MCNAPHDSPSALLVHDPHISMLASQMYVVAAMCNPCVSGTLVAINLHSWRCVVGVLIMDVHGVPLVEGGGHIMHDTRQTQLFGASCA